MGEEVREITDSLDELGNTTAAIGKGFAIGAAALAALAIISAFSAVVGAENPSFTLALTEPIVLVGMFIGVCIPFLVSSITMTAVGDAAFEMINEIRRQFREISGLMEGTAEPDSEKCVEIATEASVAISTHFSESGSAVPSINPDISLNCLLISLIISKAASPTAVMVIEETKKGIQTPINIPTKTIGSVRANVNEGFSAPTTAEKAEIIARAAKAAAPIAKPFPIAAVVFPNSSRESVISLTSSPMPAWAKRLEKLLILLMS